MIVTETKRLIIRNYLEADFECFAEMNADPRVVRFFPKPFSRDESRTAFEKIRNRIAGTGKGFYALESKATGQFVGFTGLSEPNFPAEFMPCVEIGWRLKFEFWRQGLATEAASACLEYGWNHFGLQEILSFAPVANKPSIGVMRKLGMNFVKNFPHPHLDDYPDLVDCVLYSIQAPLARIEPRPSSQSAG